MAENKKSFLVYTDLIHTMEKLTDVQAGLLIKTMLRYVNDQNPKIEDPLIDIVFEPIKQQMKRDLKEWEQQKEKYSKAGKASAEARASKKQQLYIIKCFNDNEEFIKIGVTDNGLKERFKNSKSMPYKYIVLAEYFFSKDEISPIDLENKVRETFFEKRVYPKINFAGFTECYNLSDYQDIITFVLSFLNDKQLLKMLSDVNIKETTFNDVETRSTFATVNVNDNVIVNVNDNVTVTHNNSEGDNLCVGVDQEKKKLLINALVDEFGFSEMKFANHQKVIFAFVTLLFERKESEHFIEQMRGYKEYKKLSREKLHGWRALIGTQENRFEDGAWNLENWADKTLKLKNNQAAEQKGLSSSIEKFNKVTNPYDNDEQQ